MDAYNDHVMRLSEARLRDLRNEGGRQAPARAPRPGRAVFVAIAALWYRAGRARWAADPPAPATLRLGDTET